MPERSSGAKRFLVRAAIGAGTTGLLFSLVAGGVYAWLAPGPAGTADALSHFRALFIPSALWLLAGGMVASVLFAALSFRNPHRTASAVLSGLFVVPVISCWLVVMALLWSEGLQP